MPRPTDALQTLYAQAPYEAEHLNGAWLSELTQAYASSQFRSSLVQQDNPWVQKDVARLLKKYLQNLPTRNVLLHMLNEFDEKANDELAEVIAHLRVCPQCAASVLTS